MIREYNYVHSALLELETHSEEPLSADISFENEEILLEKISELEMIKEKVSKKLEILTDENCELKKRNESLNELKNEFEKKCEMIREKEKGEFDDLKFELNKTKEDLKESQKMMNALKKENESVYKNLEEMEISQSRLNLESTQELEKTNLKNSQLEEMLALEKVSKKNVESSLKEKNEEANLLKIKINELHKNYNLLQQLNKSNESNIRSLESDVKSLSTDLQKRNESFNKMKNGFEIVAVEVRSTNPNKEKIFETIDQFFDIQEMSPICEDNLSVDSDVEEQLEINKSLEELENEFDSKQVQFDKQEIASMEIELNEISNMDSGDFEKIIQQSKTMNNSRELNDFLISKPKSKVISGINELFDGEQISVQMKKKNPVNTLKFKNEIKEKINKKIQSKSNKAEKKFSFNSNEEISMFSLASIKNQHKLQAPIAFQIEDTKTKIFEVINNLNCECLEEYEKKFIKNTWNSVDTVSDFTIFIINFLSEKFKKTVSKMKKLNSEKSKELFFIFKY